MKLAVSTVLFAGYCIAPSQLSIVSVRDTKPGEISFETAITKCTAIVEGLGFPKPVVEESRCRIIRYSQNRCEYDLRTKSGNWSCTIDPSTGRVATLRNERRRDEQYRKVGRTGTQRFSTEQAAKNFLRSMATKCGVPTTAGISSFGWKRDGEVKDANTSGAMWANYRIPGRESFQVEVDPQDGMFISFVHIIKRQ